MADRSALIIGAGITGMLVARALSRSGVDVTVLEGAHVGAGSSSRTAAGIRQQFSTRGTVAAMRYSVRQYDRLAEELGEAVVKHNGYLFLLTTDAVDGARERVAMQQDAGLTEVELLDQDALFERFPWVGRDGIVGATFCPTDGFLYPHVVYNGVADQLRARDVAIHQGAPVTAADVENGRIVAVRTPKGTFSADVVFDCTNAWTGRVAHLLGAEPLPVEPLKRYLWFIQRDEEAMSAETLLSMPLTVAPDGTYCRPENADTLLMGKKHDTAADADFTYEDQDEIEARFSHKAGIDAVPYELWAGLAEVIPAIGEFAGLAATTGGFYATTPDHNPFLGYDPRLANLVRLVGFSGHGAMMGPFTAAAAVALAEAGQDVDDVTVETGTVEMGPFAIGRAFKTHEQLVI